MNSMYVSVIVSNIGLSMVLIPSYLVSNYMSAEYQNAQELTTVGFNRNCLSYKL